jgi:hypothetical protein
MPGKTEKVKPEIVGVDKIAQLFGKSEREVQRLVIFEGMPRINRGQYDLAKCAAWYVAFLHAQVCGCAGPCDGFDPETRNATNARAERKTALIPKRFKAQKLLPCGRFLRRHGLVSAKIHGLTAFPSHRHGLSLMLIMSKRRPGSLNPEDIEC